MPAFQNAELSIAGAWHSIMRFSLVNHLSYASMAHLLQLLTFFLPNNHALPKSVRLLKKE